MLRLIGLLFFVFAGLAFSYEKKEIDISYLENYNPNIKDKNIPLNKTGNVNVRAYNRRGLIFIDSIYKGYKDIDLSLDTGKHLIYEQFGNKIVNDTTIYLNNDYSGKLNLGPKRKFFQVSGGIGYCRVIIEDETDMSLPVLNIKGNLIYKHNWSFGISGSINILEAFNRPRFYSDYKLDNKLTDDERNSMFYCGGFFELYKMFYPSRYLNVGIGLRAGIGTFHSTNYIDTLATVTLVKRDPDVPHNYKKYQYTDVPGFARIEKRKYTIELGGPSISMGIGNEKFKFTLDISSSLADLNYSAESVDEVLLDESIDYDYDYIRYANGYINEDKLVLILHLLAFLSLKF